MIKYVVPRKFSLRLLLVAFTAIACVLAIVSNRINDALAQQKTEELLRREYFNRPYVGIGYGDGKITDVRQSSIWDLFSEPINVIEFREVRNLDQVLEKVPVLTSLREIRIIDGSVTDSGAESLARFPISSLELAGSYVGVTDAGLVSLSQNRSLKQIRLNHVTEITPKGIAELKRRRPDIDIEVFGPLY